VAGRDSEAIVLTGRPRAGAPDELRRALLGWYEPRRSAYPWRGSRDPYAVLVSEVMLQQTQAARVVPAFERFMARFPSVATLASAERSAVIRAWDGLGYNRRAVFLWRAARVVVEQHWGVVPADVDALQRLPGVGRYTASAVASLAYDAPVPAVDTNVRRVVSRALAGSDGLVDDEVWPLAMGWLDGSRAADWNQAVMDLGRSLCRARPRCAECPLRPSCRYARSRAAVPPSPRRASAFAGTMRQVRGDVVSVLRRRATASIAALASQTGHPPDRVATAVAALVRDGILQAGPEALAGAPRGRARLAR
jgi:A/G-specific adenine glycosylase